MIRYHFYFPNNSFSILTQGENVIAKPSDEGAHSHTKGSSANCPTTAMPE